MKVTLVRVLLNSERAQVIEAEHAPSIVDDLAGGIQIQGIDGTKWLYNFTNILGMAHKEVDKSLIEIPDKAILTGRQPPTLD